MNAEDIFKKTMLSLPEQFTADDFCRKFKTISEQVLKEKKEKSRIKKEKQEKRDKKFKELKKQLEEWFETQFCSLTFARTAVIIMIGILVGIILLHFCSPITLVLLGLNLCISFLASTMSMCPRPFGATN